MASWFEIGLGASQGHRVIECAEVCATERRVVMILFPAVGPVKVREAAVRGAAHWAMDHEAYWQATRGPVRSVAEVVNTFAPLVEEN